MSRQLHPAEQYVDDILSGKIVSNQYIRWACERHRKDLAHVGKPGFPYHHDPERAQRVIDFAAAFCRHVEGEWAGDPIVFSPADQFKIWVVFGWVCDVPDASGLRQRRFREVYEEEARKNGKTIKLGVIGLYLTDADGEEGARVYCAATKLDQARLLHRIATQMVRKSPHLRKYFQIHKDNLHVDDTFSRFEPLGRDSETLDGLNPSGALIDEYHAHPTSEVKDVLSTGMGARRQPLEWTITTAGPKKEGPCWDLRTYAIEVLKSAARGEHINDRFAAFIYCIEEDDDPFDEKNWAKANPNLGVSVKIENMRDEAKKAQYQPRAKVNFLQKRLDVWGGEFDSWISEYAWNACTVKPFTLTDLIERSQRRRVRTWLGFDLSTRKDMTALIEWTPCAGRLYLTPYFFLPQAALDSDETPNVRLYRDWHKAGLITATPGNVIRYKFVRRQIRDIRRESKRREIVDIAGDAWNATQFMTDLEDDGFSVWAVPQTIRSLAEPAKEFEDLVADKKIAHPGHPVLNWMVQNVRVRRDENQNPLPSKKKSAGKIDGVAAAINALARFMSRKQPETTGKGNVGFRLETL
jgi:phage terminase large subunit-like protein